MEIPYNLLRSLARSLVRYSSLERIFGNFPETTASQNSDTDFQQLSARRFPMEIPCNLLQPRANHRSLAERVYGNRNKNPSSHGLFRGDRYSLNGPMYVSLTSHFFAAGEIASGKELRGKFGARTSRSILKGFNRELFGVYDT